ncbi:MAG: hypothetical protein HRT47_09285 [Candidatus Caenarcaniphilales bacterium]|nr:hypothetical protein [Candidatus Caenarcaniphilales bacterium]
MKKVISLLLINLLLCLNYVQANTNAVDAIDDNISVIEGEFISISADELLANDNVPAGAAPGTVQIQNYTFPTELPLSFDSVTNTFQVQSYHGQLGLTDSFTYTVYDLNTGITDTATVNLTVVANPNAVDAIDDNISVIEGEFISISADELLANDTVIAGAAPGSVQIQNYSFPAELPLSFDSVTNTFQVQSYHGQIGLTDSFTYTVYDLNTGTTDTATVNITVVANPNAVDAVDDNISVIEGEFISISADELLANDNVIVGAAPGTVQIQNYTFPAELPLSFDSVTNTFQVQSYQGQAGITDSFTYTVYDLNTGTTDTATVNLTVIANPNGVNAVDDNVSIIEGEFINIDVLANDEAFPGAPPGTLQIQNYTIPAELPLSFDHVTNTFQVQSYQGQVGITDSFTYTVIDFSTGTTDTATVNITVVANPNGFDAVDDEVTVVAGFIDSVDVFANDLGTSGPGTIQILSYTNPSQLAPVYFDYGTNTFQITSDPWQVGLTDTFTYTAMDINTGTVDTATVTITIGADPNAYDAVDDEVTVVAGFIDGVDVFANDVIAPISDPSAIQIMTFTNPAQLPIWFDPGTNTFQIQTDPSQVGVTDTFTYTAMDIMTGTIDTATVTVTVVPDPNAFNAVDDSVTAIEGETVSVDVFANDEAIAGAGPGSIQIMTYTNPAQLPLSFDYGTNTFQIQSFPGQAGITDTFTYTAMDINTGTIDTATVTITVNPSN